MISTGRVGFLDAIGWVVPFWLDEADALPLASVHHGVVADMVEDVGIPMGSVASYRSSSRSRDAVMRFKWPTHLSIKTVDGSFCFADNPRLMYGRS